MPGRERCSCRNSGTAYLFVNAAHILGIGLLVGSILPLDLRLAGCFRSVPLVVIGPFLMRVAAAGGATAVLMGLWLFSVKPSEYVANTAFLWKMALLAAALANVILQHRSRDFVLAMEGGSIGAPGSHPGDFVGPALVIGVIGRPVDRVFVD